MFTQPAFYEGLDPDDETYKAVLPLVRTANGKGVKYGTAEDGPLPNNAVVYSKASIQGSKCFIRSVYEGEPEADLRELIKTKPPVETAIIARDAEDLDLDLRVQNRAYEVRVWFLQPYRHRSNSTTITNDDGTPVVEATVVTSDSVMLRNTREEHE